jgi:hypothetical protein
MARRRIFSSPPAMDSGKKKPKTEFERFDALAKIILLPKQATPTKPKAKT